VLLLTKNASQWWGGQQKTMVIREMCPKGKDCGRQFVECFEQYLIVEDKRALNERLLVERISLRGMYRAVGVRLKCLLGFLVTCFEAFPDH
jgi:hypothetical protein